MKPIVWQQHHLIYGLNDNPRRQKDVIVPVRKGVHRLIHWIRRYNYLTNEEVWAICLEAEIKRRFETEEKLEKGE